MKTETKVVTCKEFTALARAACVDLKGAEFNEETFAKAMAKAKRHMRNKYGSVNYEQEMGESGTDNVTHFYWETTKLPDGKRTFNREMDMQRRMDTRWQGSR